MENPRTTDARDHDDSAIIDDATLAPGFSGASGGDLQRDVASAAEQAEVADPEASTGVEKSDTIEHGTARPRDRARAPDAGQSS